MSQPATDSRVGDETTPLLLGVDLGTSQLKLLAVDLAGRPVASKVAPIATTRPQPGWAEQQPEEWWAALVAACREMWASLNPRRIVAVGLSGQMHGATFVDDAGEPLGPALIWADSRTAPQVAALERIIPPADLLRIGGNPANTSFTATKIMWLREQRPDLFASTRRVLLAKDYLRWRLTGEYATDVSDASATLLFDLHQRDWSADLLHALDLDPALLPPVYESAMVCGRITAAAAVATGLLAGLPVVAGGGDAACSAFGLGLADSDEAALVSIGTSAQIFAVSDQPVVDQLGRVHSLCHVVPSRWHMMGAVLAGGATLHWWRDLLTAPGGQPPDFDALTEAAATVAPGAAGVLLLPYLLGERTPHMTAAARGVFYGLRLDHDRRHLTRAVLEGVAFALRDGLEVLRECGLSLSEVRLTGGGARSGLWAAILRDVFGLPLRRCDERGAAHGAALLDGIGVGAFGYASVPAPPAIEPTMPEPLAVADYTTVYQRWRRLYPALAAEFRLAQE